MNHNLLVFDNTTIRKYGPGFWGLDLFYSSTEKKAVWGIELFCTALINTSEKGAYHLSAYQTPPKKEKGENRTDFYIKSLNHTFDQITRKMHVSADGYFASLRIFDAITSRGHEFITRLKSNSVLYKSIGKNHAQHERIQIEDFTESKTIQIRDGKELFIRYGIVHVNAFRKTRCLVVAIWDRKENKLAAMLVSTDCSLTPENVALYYKSRFQHEFLFRDAKQYTGLGDCQCRIEGSQEFFGNIALSAVSIKRVEKEDESDSFSMASEKLECQNQYMIYQVLDALGLNHDIIEDPEIKRKLKKMGLIAA